MSSTFGEMWCSCVGSEGAAMCSERLAQYRLSLRPLVFG